MDNAPKLIALSERTNELLFRNLTRLRSLELRQPGLLGLDVSKQSDNSDFCQLLDLNVALVAKNLPNLVYLDISTRFANGGHNDVTETAVRCVMQLGFLQWLNIGTEVSIKDTPESAKTDCWPSVTN